MSILNKYNNNLNPFDFEQVKNPDYKNLRELYNDGKTKITIYGLFINTKSKFGDSPVAETKGFNINLPNHLTETVREMIQDEEVVQLANNNGLAIEIYEYETKKWGVNYSVNFVESGEEVPF